MIHRLAANPDALGVLLTDGIKEVVGFGEEAGWHAWVNAEDRKGEEVTEGHGAADEGESVGVRSFMIVPRDETLRMLVLTFLYVIDLVHGGITHSTVPGICTSE